jgi:hypothetical protein
MECSVEGRQAGGARCLRSAVGSTAARASEPPTLTERERDDNAVGDEGGGEPAAIDEHAADEGAPPAAGTVCQFGEASATPPTNAAASAGGVAEAGVSCCQARTAARRVVLCDSLRDVGVVVAGREEGAVLGGAALVGEPRIGVGRGHEARRGR